MTETIKIIIADSHFLSRKGLSVLLTENVDFTLLSEETSSSDLIGKAKIYKPNLIIIDYVSQNFGLESLQQIVKKFPTAKLLAITELNDAKVIAKAMKIGVTSHLLKDCDQDEIIEAIYKTTIGEKFMCGKIVDHALSTDEKAVKASEGASCEGLNISDRELEIITLIAEGLSNKEVADKLFLSTHTVTTHRKNIMNKLGVNNTAGLVLYAVRENLVSPNHFLFSSVS